MTTPQSQISAHLHTTKALPVSPTWLNSFVSSMTAALQRNVPISALTQTALFRILASDFRDSLQTDHPSALLPGDIFDLSVQERRLPGPVPVQVLDIEDIGTSLWSQVEAIERVERGEAIRGREIVRAVNVGGGGGEEGDDEEGAGSGNTAGATASSEKKSHGPHRLIVQDAAGTRAVAIELKRVQGISVAKLAIGAKMVIRNATVARGMILLTPDCITLLGGKIESMDQAWKEGRKARLLARITEMQGEDQSSG
ncbi:OB fold domain-containing protein [Aspergillus brunneoviolaceus CBS 621.78]|uniref:RecQ-mediated genome instability protein n=1 Tax=Aspergillus brunneoviolaceus CBS 621.78 TaxID=1450534 RepID=A0ACD1G370_9EURO|nr:putative RecQ-mediated genome instability protein [Aspergillus brunneoviolaceus CBS 621.78]RAH43690.1 putative RecQ-mediated genome instability protein [Aspergillus brunneoviolaceus CBS 621.78]